MVLHKILSLPAELVSRNIFIRKLVLYINDMTHVTSGFIPDICHILLKYNLHSIINNFLAPECYVPSKYVWKSVVKRSIISRETQLWDYRTSVDTDFVFFRILHPCITTCIIYKVCNRTSLRNTMFVISRLWSRPVTHENRTCINCGKIYQEELVHVICECPSTSELRSQCLDTISDILLPEHKQSLLLQDSVSQTLKLLGAPIKPILDCETEVTFLRTAFPFIVQCLRQYVM